MDYNPGTADRPLLTFLSGDRAEIGTLTRLFICKTLQATDYCLR